MIKNYDRRLYLPFVIYASMEHGNIGKLVVALEEAIWVYTADCMGGNRRGRDSILQLVPAFYRPGTGIKRVGGRIYRAGQHGN